MRSWILRRALLGFVVAALVAPAVAQARLDPAAQPGKADTPARMEVTKQEIREAIEMRRVDSKNLGELAPHHGAASEPMIPSEFVDQRDAAPQVVSSSGFNWGDAAIGAGVGIALVLLVGGAVSASHQIRKPRTV